MTTSPEIQRKVRQLDNDVQAIYEMLAGISASMVRHGNRLNEMDDKLADMGGKVDAMGGKVDAMGGKVDAMGGKVDAMGGKLDTITDLLRASNGERSHG